MPRSSAATEVEVLGLTPHALWLLVGERVYMLDFGRFPWFEKASIQDVRRCIQNGSRWSPSARAGSSNPDGQARMNLVVRDLEP
jgi:hypothetical protein